MQNLSIVIITLACLGTKDFIKPKICFEDIIAAEMGQNSSVFQEGGQVTLGLIISVLYDWRDVK